MTYEEIARCIPANSVAFATSLVLLAAVVYLGIRLWQVKRNNAREASKAIRYVKRLEEKLQRRIDEHDKLKLEYAQLQGDVELVKSEYRATDKTLHDLREKHKTLTDRALRYQKERNKADADLIKKNFMLDEFAKKVDMLTQHIDTE